MKFKLFNANAVDIQFQGIKVKNNRLSFKIIFEALPAYSSSRHKMAIIQLPRYKWQYVKGFTKEDLLEFEEFIHSNIKLLNKFIYQLHNKTVQINNS